MPPLERHPQLRPLSREHHHGLLLCWRIRRDLVERRDHGQVLAECRTVFERELLPHFAVEEEAVFPVLGADDPLVRRAIAEHRRIARLFLRKENKHCRKCGNNFCKAGTKTAQCFISTIVWL